MNHLYFVLSASSGDKYSISSFLGAMSRRGIQSSTGTILSTLFPQKSKEDIFIVLLSSLMYKNPITFLKGQLAAERTPAPVTPEKLTIQN